MKFILNIILFIGISTITNAKLYAYFADENPFVPYTQTLTRSMKITNRVLQNELILLKEKSEVHQSLHHFLENEYKQCSNLMQSIIDTINTDVQQHMEDVVTEADNKAFSFDRYSQNLAECIKKQQIPEDTSQRFGLFMTCIGKSFGIMQNPIIDVGGRIEKFETYFKNINLQIGECLMDLDQQQQKPIVNVNKKVVACISNVAENLSEKCPKLEEHILNGLFDFSEDVNKVVPKFLSCLNDGQAKLHDQFLEKYNVDIDKCIRYVPFKV